MKESDFIEQNKEKWKNFEHNLLKKDATPQEISKLFVQITDDLSYARTFYRARSVKIYLNGVAKLLFNDINKAKKNNWSVVSDFWIKELPLVIYSARRAMLISFLVFWSCFVLGVVTSIYSPDFARTILGDSYIEMTNKNIADGSPMHVYADSGEMETFLPILLNNLKVAFTTFFLGVFASIGSLIIMMYNGVMVGVFQFFFVEKDALTAAINNSGALRGFFQYFFLENNLFRKSFLSIWTHGTLEISAIIIAGGAGITLGKGLLFPRTYTRFQAFKMSARNGLKIIIGISPVILLAAFVEGFVTRHTDISSIIRFSFILLSLAFVIIYFVWYPRRIAKKTTDFESIVDVPPVYNESKPFNPYDILSVNQLFSETLRLFFKNFSTYFLLVFGCSVFFVFPMVMDPLELFFIRDYYTTEYTLVNYFNYSEFPLTGVLGGILFLLILVSSILFTQHRLKNTNNTKFSFKKTSFSNTLISCLMCVSIFVGLIVIGNGWVIFLAFLLLPLLVLMCCISVNENSSFFRAVGQIGRLLHKSWWKFIALSLLLSVISMLSYTSFVSVFVKFIIRDGLIWSLTANQEMATTITIALAAFLISFSFLTYLILIASSSGVLYFTLKETYTAENLIDRISRIKSKK
ncbi:MAG: hypothetical protein COX70_09130 [Flavobacteriales bacterium CG_4_10_14_0_2_um_filter_32_8]|nr:MAG: hypothetical protein COX70_09130 [Flavobacteriales bacterium CG_4_10_14_0_2_um_filter_32_8]